MNLEFVINSMINYKIVKIMTIWYGINYHNLKMDSIYVIRRQCKISNNTACIFNQEKIIQKWTLKTRLQTVRNNEQSKKQGHKQSSLDSEIKIQPSLHYELEQKQLNYNLNCLNKYERNYLIIRKT